MTMLSSSYIAVPYPREPEDSVLDLCVKKRESTHVEEIVNRQDGSCLQGMDLCSRGLSRKTVEGQPTVFSPVIVQDTGYAATMAVLQQRFLEDKLRSPPLSSDHDGSIRSDSPSLSPEYMPLTTLATSSNKAAKPKRPFKAYPKNPLNLVGPAITEGFSASSNEAYAEFRRRMLEQVHASTGNKNMKRPVQSVSPTNQQPSSSMDARDAAYWERRRKNNEAAKRSRDARRAKEDEIAIRAAFLEQENVKLKYEVAALRNETSRLRCMLFSN